MMATTHAYVSLALAVASLPVTARHAPASSVFVVTFVGGLAPDLDLVTNHRKTLHFPVLLPIGACGLAALYGVLGHPALALLSFGAASAGLHSLTDVLAGGLGHEPWDTQSDRAVYNHVLSRWHVPRRLVRYSGAPEDFLLGAAFAVPTVLSPATGPRLDLFCVVVLVGSAGFAATRRQLPLVVRTVRTLYPSLCRWLPGVRIEDN